MKQSIVSIIRFSLLSVVLCSYALSYSSFDVKRLPQDMSFCIADVKYHDKAACSLSACNDADNQRQHALKILEFGEGARSRFKGHKQLVGAGCMWALYWDHAAQFNIPMWLVGVPKDDELREEMNMNHFFARGGREVDTLHALKRAIEASLVVYYGNVTDQHRQAYAAMVMIRKGRPTKTVKKMKTLYPNIIFVGQMSNKFVNNKYRMNLLFMTDELKQYRPSCRTCPVEYTPTTAQSLINDLGGDIFVLKPINSSKGRGILIVAKEDLDTTLKVLFHDPATLITSNLSEEYKYWATYKSPFFLVEQYEPSKNIIIDGKPYDATMRLVFALDRHDEVVKVTIFDGYWKLPAHPLTADCPLTDKHKSHINPEILSSVKIDLQDMERAQQLLEDALHKVYWHMVQTRFLALDYTSAFEDEVETFDR